MYLTYEESVSLMKRVKEDLKNLVGPVPTPKLHLAVEKIRKDNKIKETNNAVDILHKRYIGDDIKRQNSIQNERDNLQEEINEIFTEANEYDVEKIKRKLDMFLKTNDLQYLEKVLYLTKELIKEN